MAIIMVMATGISFNSCKEDDNNENLGENTPASSAGIIDASSSLRLKTIGNQYHFTINYTDGGLIDYIENQYQNEYNKFEFNYNPNTITYTYDKSYESGSNTYVLNYNNKGLVSTIEINGENIAEDEKWVGTESSECTYDENGHLTSISYSGQETGTIDGKEKQYNYTGKLTLIWENNLLQKWMTELEYNNEGSATTIYTYSYDEEYTNKFKQWVNIWNQADETDMWKKFASIILHLGLMGTGPDELPSNIEIHRTEDTYSSDKSLSCSYTFNEDGSVASANGVNYTYETANDTRVSVSSNEITEHVAEPLTSTKRHHRRPLFMR